MLDAMAGRGDRPSVVLEAGDTTLGCRRLAIVDRDRAEQPLRPPGSGLTIVFNGEIYNHQELAAELRGRGVQFATASDTEVLLRAWEVWREATLDHLEGMYAFVIHNAEKGELWAGRDPFGIKPLFERRHAGGLEYASELKAFPLKCRAGAVRFPPGALACNGQIIARVDIFGRIEGAATELAEAAADVRERLEASVRSMVQTDLPIAVLASGGIDSSAVLLEAARAHPDVTAFTIGLSASAPDVRAAARVAAHVGVPHTFVEVGLDSLLESIPVVVSTIESFEPNHIRGGTLSYALARAVHEAGFKIALCGEGADELFSGYPEFAACLLSGGSDEDLRKETRTFVGQLDRTQLQRVDRTAMAWQLEVRVPFLDLRLARYALAVPTHLNLTRDAGASFVNKRVLREAYRGVLPDEIVDRKKLVLSEGAGAGDNSARGPFVAHAGQAISESEWRLIVAAFPEYCLATAEEALYFRTFHERYGRWAPAAARPRVNQLPTQ